MKKLKIYVIFFLLLGCVRNVDGSLVNGIDGGEESGAIFDAENQCKPHDMTGAPYYWQCGVANREVQSSAISVGDQGFMARYIDTLPIEYHALFSFPCNPNGGIGTSILRYLDKDYHFASTQTPTLQKLTWLGSVKDVHANILVNFPQRTIVNDACRLDLVAFYAMPPIHALKIYADQFESDYKQLGSALLALDDASRLPAKWIVARNLSDELRMQSGANAMHCKAYLRELQGLLASSSGQRTEGQIARIRELSGLPGEDNHQLDFDNICPLIRGTCGGTLSLDALGGRIGEYQSSSVRDICLAEDLQESLPDSDECSSDNDVQNTFCLEKIDVLRSVVAGQMQSISAAVDLFVDYLNKEQLRMLKLEVTISQEITDIINSLRGLHEPI